LNHPGTKKKSLRKAFYVIAPKDEDKHALKAARIMGDIYYELIKKIEKQNYQIFNRRLSVSKAKKVFFLIKGML